MGDTSEAVNTPQAVLSAASDWVVEAVNLTKIYQIGTEQVNALFGLSTRIARGEGVAIMGPAGSG